MKRWLRRGLILGGCLVVLGGAFLWALPEIVRRVALDQIPKRTGRAATIEDVDLNLFTGHLAVKHFRLADREGPEPLVAFERLDVRLSPLALLAAHVRVREISLAAPSIHAIRIGPAEFNFSDLLGPSQERASSKEPPKGASRWTVSLDRLSITRGRVRAEDRAVSPAAEWLIQDLGVEVASLTTRAGAAPGRAAVHARINEAVLDVSADPARLEPLRIDGKLSLDGFNIERLEPYVYAPLQTPYRPRGGRLGVTLSAALDTDAETVRKAVLAGAITLDSNAFTEVGKQDPFASSARFRLDIGEADLVGRTLTVSSAAIEGFDLKARRGANGVIDVVELFTRRGPASPPSSTRPAALAASAPAPSSPQAGRPPAAGKFFPLITGLAQGFKQIRIEHVTLAPGTVTFVDETVTPTTTLALSDLQVRLDDLTWPVLGPAALALAARMPGGGTVDVRGPVTVQPVDLQLTVTLRNAPIEPYQAYIPVPARLSGRFNGDSKNRIALRDGRLLLLSTGNSWAEKFEIREPGAERPAIRVERMELIGIDFDWPRRAAVVKAGFRRPAAEIEREADGSVNLRTLFTPPGERATPPPEPKPVPAPKSVPEGPKPKGLLETMQLEFKEIRVEDGFIRFLDRTTKPAFSQDLSRLELGVTDLGNRPGQRAKVALQSVVGGDAGLDIRGEIGSIGSPAFIDLVGELRSFKLASVDPYMAANIGWIIKRGELQYKVRFKLDDDQLAATNEVVVGRLQVAPASGADEVKRRIGLPLGLIVALVKDQRGEIRVNVPVAGSVKDPKFDLRDAIWTAIKNVLVNIVTAPFKAIGSLFSSGEKIEEPKVDPVTFPAGSSVLSPAMEEHLVRVGDFLRRAPFVNLALTAVPAPADLDALKAEAVATRLRDFQAQRGLGDPAAALAAYYKERLPDVARPPTVDEQLALLREHEPAPEGLVAALDKRRLEVTQERLLKVEGIPAERLTVADAAPAAAAAAPTPAAGSGNEGRVEFAIVAGGD